MLKRLIALCCTFILILFCAIKIYAENNQLSADSLRKLLQTAKGVKRVKTLNSLADVYMYSDGRKALAYSIEAFHEGEHLNNTELMGVSLIQQGLAYSNLGSYDTSINVIRRALKLQTWDKKSINLGRLYTVLGIANEGAGINDSALYYYHEAFHVYYLAGNDQGIVNTYLNLGCLFMRLKKFDEAEVNLKRALDESFKRKALKALGSIYNNLGVVEDVKGKKKNALNYYSKALKYQEVVGNISGTASIYHNIAIIHFDLDEYDQAIENFEKSIALKFETGNREGIATSYSSMAEVFLKMKQTDKAEQYVSKAIQIANRDRYLVVEAQAHKQLARIYAEQGRYKDASVEWERAFMFNDSLYNQSVSRQLSEMQAHYELKQKDQENLILRQRESQQRISNRFLTFAIIAIAIVGLLLLILLRMKILSMRKTRALFEFELSARNTSILLKNKELTTLSANFISQSEILGQIKNELVSVKEHIGEKPAESINDLITMVNSNLDIDLNWKKFKMSFEESHPGFLERLTKLVPGLSLNEQKLCAFIFVGLSSNEMAQVMNISLAAVNKSRQRMRKKMQLPDHGDINEFLSEV
jgi:tetratricopeptide (TPR) repeat protein/DNA-binding CsgD family transcriptional regulator